MIPIPDPVGGIEAVIRAWGGLGRLARWRRKRQALRALRETETIRAHPQLHEYLRHRLAETPVDIGGRTATLMTRRIGTRTLDIPVVLLWVGGEIRLERPSEDEHKEQDWERSDYVRYRRALGARIWDDLVYEARMITVGTSHVDLHCGLTRYGSSLATSDALEFELLTEGAKIFTHERLDSLAFRRLTERLTMRRAVEAASPNYLLDARGRCNGIGISTVLVYPDSDDSYRVMFGKRSAVTGSNPGLFHSIPACMFQPELDVHDEFDIQHNVLKEYGEELHGETLDHSALYPDYFYDRWPSVHALRQALAEGQCLFQVSGLVVSLLTLRPEICTLLLIKDASWWQRQRSTMSSNWEYVDRGEISTRRRQARTSFDLDSVEDQFVQLGHSAGSWVAPGLAALWLAVDVARRELGA